MLTLDGGSGSRLKAYVHMQGGRGQGGGAGGRGSKIMKSEHTSFMDDPMLYGGFVNLG